MTQITNTSYSQPVLPYDFHKPVEQQEDSRMDVETAIEESIKEFGDRYSYALAEQPDGSYQVVKQLAETLMNDPLMSAEEDLPMNVLIEELFHNPSASVSSDIHLAALLALVSYAAVCRCRRIEHQQARKEQMSAQMDAQDRVLDVMKSQGFWGILTGVISGTFGIVAGLSPAISPMFVSLFNGVDINALTDQQKNIVDTINKVLGAVSQASDTTGRVISTCKETTRYPHQTAENHAKTGYDDYTRMSEEDLQTMESVKNLILQLIQSRHETAKSVLNR